MTQERIMLSVRKNPEEFTEAWKIAKSGIGSGDDEQAYVDEIFEDGALSAQELLDLGKKFEEKEVFIARNQLPQCSVREDQVGCYQLHRGLIKYMQQAMEQIYTLFDKKFRQKADDETAVVTLNQTQLCVQLYDLTAAAPVRLSSRMVFQKAMFDLYAQFSSELMVGENVVSGSAIINKIVSDEKITFADINTIGVCRMISDD